MKPRIVLENEVFRKVMYWVHKSNMEVSGLGKVKLEPNGVIRVVDAMLLPQRVGSTHTDIEAEDVNRALYLLRESEGELKWWWHSHVDMGVFWSGTDMDTIKKLGAGGWFANSVFNKKREIRSATYVQQGQRVNLPWNTEQAFEPLFLDELETKVVEYRDPKADEWDAEYDRNVKIGAPIIENRKYPQYSGGVGEYWNGTQKIKWEGGKRYIQLPNGEWLQKDWEYNSPGESRPATSGLSGTTDTRGIGTIDPTQEPPANRPPGMSKRVYKAWKKHYRERQAKVTEIGHKVVQGLNQIALETEVCDEMGFTQEEKMMLAQEGWDDDEVERAMIDQDLSPNEILELARYGVGYNEMIYMMAQGWTLQGILNLGDDSNPELRKYQ